MPGSSTALGTQLRSPPVLQLPRGLVPGQSIAPRAPFLGAVLSSLWTQLLLLICDETWGNYLICCLPGACAQLGQASGLRVRAVGFPHALIKK